MNKLFLIAGFLSALCLGEDLPALKDGHWYSRTVDAKKGVLVYHDTYLSVQPGGEVVSAYSTVKQTKLPNGYKAGELGAALPAAGGGSWYTYSESDGQKSTFESYYVYDSYGFRLTRHRFLLSEPTKTVVPAKGAEAPEKKPALEAATEKGDRKPGKRLAPSLLGSAPLVGESKQDVTGDLGLKPAIAPKALSRGPEKFVAEVPSMATSLNWNQEAPHLSAKDRAFLVRTLRTTGPELSRWQYDLAKRFLTCTEGKCLVRDRGKGKIEVPFQVGLGRIWALSLEVDRLGYAMEEQNLSEKEEREQLLQLVQRLDSLQALLEYSRQESKSNYGDKIDVHLALLKKSSRNWNLFSSQPEKTWALRWQVLSRDIRAFEERAERLQPHLPEPLKSLAMDSSRQLRDLLKEAGDKPWERSSDAQYDLAKQLYFEVTAPLRKGYRDLARHADTLRDQPQEYIDLLVLMGTAENLGVYGWTIMEELAEK